MKREAKNSTGGQKPGRFPQTFAPSGQAQPPGRGRQWLFRVSALLLVLVLPLGLLELGLRVAGYGYPTGFFEKMRSGDQDYLTGNDSFTLRFFPPQLVRTVNAFRMKAEKPPGTFRIFILGESAAMGDPAPAYSASRYLEALLQERYPGQTFEVINTGITAINSNVILPIARDCARHEGDMWIIYMGNNEMVGPFGAATVFGRKAAPLKLIRPLLAVQKTRTGQLLMALARKLTSAKSSSWGGMQMFMENQVYPTDPRKATVYHNFQGNLEDILRAGLDSGAKILLNTIAVNLKDCPPLASLANPNLPVVDRARFDELRADGSSLERQGNWEKAARSFEEATGFDARFAEVQFRWAECLLRQTNYAAARRQFQEACDVDALPFRADSRINTIITEVGGQFASRGLALFDAAAMFAINSPAGIPGEEAFYEHVHFNFDGNYRLGRAWAEQVEHFLPAAARSDAAPGWASQETCERRLGLTDWNRYDTVKLVIQRVQRPPMSNRVNNERQLAVLGTEAQETNRRMDATGAARAREIYLEARNRAPEDYWVHGNFADFLVARGQLEEAEQEWRRVHELLPHDYFADFQLGSVLANEGKLAEAEVALTEGVARRPHLAEAWLQLGRVRVDEGKHELALQDLERARLLRPNNPECCYQTARALWKLNRRAEAIAQFREALRFKPDYVEARLELGAQLGLDGRLAEARKEFEELIRLKPDIAAAHLNLGVVLVKQDQPDEAAREFEEALRLNPADPVAPDYLRQARAMKSGKP